MTGAELLAAYSQGRRDFGGESLKALDLSGNNLAGIVFDNVCLERSRLEDANLSGASFKNAVVDGAWFDGSNLRDSEWAGCQGAVVSFRGADLTGAGFEGANFSDSDFQGAVWQGVRLGTGSLVGCSIPGIGVWADGYGTAFPLGATWVTAEQRYNFALFSADADSVTLLLFGEDPANPVASFPFDPRRNKTGRVWHFALKPSDVGEAKHYAYRVSGSNDDPTARFDPDKFLFDPYAPAIYFPPKFDLAKCAQPGTNAGFAPLGELPATEATAFDWGDSGRVRHTSDTIIYELHVRGYTMRENSGVEASRRGTFAGLVEKIPYLLDLGVTTVELLPITLWLPGPEGNYWGYMPAHFFSLHPAYASTPGWQEQARELKAMVKALHAAGIEVVMDVVYNHTAEMGEGGAVISLRGIDNGAYYRMSDGGKVFANDTGTGNTLRTSHPAVRKLVVDSLRFWTNEFHIDGFRFDLASVFARNDDGSINVSDPPILHEIASAAGFDGLRLIAEPWDVGLVDLGRGFPATTWSQWNARFRDDIRDFVRGRPGAVGNLMTRLYGSTDLFPDRGDTVYRPYQSVNFATCHDGFCLYDLVSYDYKHNEANGNGNNDGTDDNRSWNCGWEGDVNVPDDVLALRRRQVKNFCCLVFLAAGTPMFVAGDEFMNTQHGNNNPYNQDNPTTWLDWSLLEKNADIHRFFKRMIALRRRMPQLGTREFWSSAVSWYGVSGSPDLSYESRSLAFRLSGAEGVPPAEDLYVMANAWWQPLTFTIQESGEWRRLVDTSQDSPNDILEFGAAVPLSSRQVSVGPRSIVVLIKSP